MRQKMQKDWRVYVFVLLFTPVLSVVPETDVFAKAKSQKTAMNKTKLTMVVKDKYTLKMTGTSKKVKWSSNKKVWLPSTVREE